MNGKRFQVTDWEQYGREVRALREARGWSQAELGVHAGTSQANIRDVERGNYKNGPHADTVRGIQEALGRRPGEDGYKLTANYVGKARADVIADGGDPLSMLIQSIPEDRRSEVAEAIRGFLESESPDPSR